MHGDWASDQVIEILREAAPGDKAGVAKRSFPVTAIAAAFLAGRIPHGTVIGPEASR